MNENESEKFDRFDAFLTEAAEDARMHDINEGLKIAIREHIHTNLQFFDVPYLTDEKAQLQNDTVEKIRLDIIESQPDVSMDEKVKLFNKTIRTQSVREQTLYAHIRHELRWITYRTLNKHEQEAVNTRKRQMIAKWVIESNLRSDSAWLPFLNETYPGDIVSDDDLAQEMINYIDDSERREARKLDVKLARMIASDAAGLSVLFSENPLCEMPLYFLAMSRLKEGDANFESKMQERAITIQSTTDAVRTYVSVLRAANIC